MFAQVQRMSYRRKRKYWMIKWLWHLSSSAASAAASRTAEGPAPFLHYCSAAGPRVCVSGMAPWIDCCTLWLARVGAEARHPHHLSSDADYRTFLIVAGLSLNTLDERREVLTANFFKRHVLASSSVLHSLLPDRRDNDTVSSLRNPKPFHTIQARTNKFRKSFIPTVSTSTHSYS